MKQLDRFWIWMLILGGYFNSPKDQILFMVLSGILFLISAIGVLLNEK